MMLAENMNAINEETVMSALRPVQVFDSNNQAITPEQIPQNAVVEIVSGLAPRLQQQGKTSISFFGIWRGFTHEGNSTTFNRITINNHHMEATNQMTLSSISTIKVLADNLQQWRANPRAEELVRTAQRDFDTILRAPAR